MAAPVHPQLVRPPQSLQQVLLGRIELTLLEKHVPEVILDSIHGARV